jgi:hypothetical protein
MSYNENLNPEAEILPDDSELEERFRKDKSYLMRLAAKLTHAAQNLSRQDSLEPSEPSSSFDKLTRVVDEINTVTQRLGGTGLKLIQSPEVTSDTNEDLEAAS